MKPNAQGTSSRKPTPTTSRRRRRQRSRKTKPCDRIEKTPGRGIKRKSERCSVSVFRRAAKGFAVLRFCLKKGGSYAHKHRKSLGLDISRHRNPGVRSRGIAQRTSARDFSRQRRA